MVAINAQRAFHCQKRELWFWTYPPLGAEGAGLADLNEEPPTRPPERAAKASLGAPADTIRAAAKATVAGKRALEEPDCA